MTRNIQLPSHHNRTLSKDPRNYPIVFFLNDTLYFANWDWKKFYKRKKQFVVEKIPPNDFLNHSTRSYKSFKRDQFIGEIGYLKYILGLLISDKLTGHIDDPVIDFGNVVFYIKNSREGIDLEKDYGFDIKKRIVGDWTIFDTVLYRKLKNMLSIIGLDYKTKRGIKIQENKEYIILKIYVCNILLGYWLMKERNKNA